MVVEDGFEGFLFFLILLMLSFGAFVVSSSTETAAMSASDASAMGFAVGRAFKVDSVVMALALGGALF